MISKTVPIAAAATALVGLLLLNPAMAQKKYGPGVTDTEITIGQTMPYSGPVSAYATIGKADAAYIAMINAEGGINGRKIKLISLDDGYSPPKTVEQTRKLVEEDNILLDFNPLGTPTNTAIHRYLNSKKVPQLFVATGATKWGDPKEFPWTMGWQPSYQTEGRLFAKYLLEHEPNAKIGVLYQDDDYGKDYLKGLKDGLGSKAAKMIVKEESYETTDTTIDQQIISLQSSGANVFYDVTTPKFAAQAINKAYDLGWKPLHYLNSVSASVAAVLRPAGLDKSRGIVTAEYLKDPTDPQWKNDAAYKQWSAWMKKYYPDGDQSDAFNVYGYAVTATLVQVLKQCGNDLTRENVMKQAAHLDFHAPMLLPGIVVKTSPTHFYPIDELQLAKFNGQTWVAMGHVLAMK
ncbi:MAG TPA: ABC transporter substrate-binding protein [Stellaceae bacterium]|nr:ABC transporter substrate-binding protein [Stellaceae bacterium]